MGCHFLLQSISEYYTIIYATEMATHFSILVWRISWKEEPGRLQSMELQRVRHDWATHIFTFKLLKDILAASNFYQLWIKLLEQVKNQAKEYSLKKVPVEFYDTVVVEHERNRRLMYDAIFLLSHWKNGLPTYWNGEGCGNSDLEK